MPNIFFTADTHYNHDNIASVNTSKWGKGFRHYKSVTDMNYHLVKGINDTVGQDDILYHVGDWSFGGINSIWDFRSRLICKNIHLILGNHDQHIEGNGKMVRLGIQGQSNTRDLFSSVDWYKEISIGKQKIVLSHYAHRIWHGSHKGWIHLYGHSHDSLDFKKDTGKLVEYGKSMDCGIDSAIRILGEARPFSYEEITKIMDKRDIHFPDHHDSRTNT